MIVELFGHVESRPVNTPVGVHFKLKSLSEEEASFEEKKMLGVVGYCDSDFAGDYDKRRSLSGYIFTVGGNVVSWKSNLQHVVALSTTEAEYIVLTEAVNEALWLKGFLDQLDFKQEQVVVHCDSQSAIHLSKNTVFHERTKHIDVKLYFLRDIVAKGMVKVNKIATEINPADIMTKVIPVGKFNNALNLLKIKE